MEHDDELTEPDSNIRFIVPDSQFSDDSSQDLGQLPALKPQLLCAGEKSLPAAEGISSCTTMSERKANPYFNFSSATESEIEEQGILLAVDTVNDTSDSLRSETERNVTVVERVTTPKKIRSLQFSGEHILVAETVESYDEVEPTPDAFDSVPMVIPDSPCMDDKEEESDESGEITFRPVCPTVDQEYQLTPQASTVQESQSYHLKLTPSQSDVLYASEAEEITKENVITKKTSTMKSPLLQDGSQLDRVSKGSKPLPSFSSHDGFLAPKEVESTEGSEECLSVFRRVKSSSTTPQKHKVILDDSDEFSPLAELTSFKRKIGLCSSSKRQEQTPFASSAKPPTSSKGQEQFIGKQDDLSNVENNRLYKDIDDVSSSFNAQLGVGVTEIASSKHVDVDLTLSYDYTAVDKSLSVSHDQSIDMPNAHISIQANAASHIGQTCDKSADSPEKCEHRDVTAEQSAVNLKNRINPPLEQPIAQSITLSEESCSKIRHSQRQTVLPSTSLTNKRALNNENCGCQKPDHCPHRKARRNEDSSKVDASKDLNDNTSVAPKDGSDDLSALADRIEEATTVVGDTNTSFSKVAISSDISALKQSKSADPYTFSGTQSQTVKGASCLELTERSHLTASRGSRRIKLMKKVFRKLVPPKMEGDKFSSTDDTSNPDHSRKHPKSRVQSVRGRKPKKVHKEAEENQHARVVTPEQRQEQDNQQQLPGAAVSEPTQFTSLQKKIQFNKPLDPDRSKAGPSILRQDSSAHETQQLNEGQQKSGIQSKKITTSTEVAAELSESSEHDVERTTVQRIYTSIFIITEKTITEVHSSKGTLIRRSENTVEVDRRVVSNVTSEKATEHVIVPELSPSRSVSTMTTGDLADISSSSLSRINSSGSKSGNPSIDAVHSDQSLPSAQRQHPLEKQDNGRPLQENESRPDSGLPGAVPLLLSVVQPKRHSASSSSGKDLFSTPDQSIIDRADSDIGKVVSSSNSTPCCESLISPSTAIRKPDHEDTTKFTTPVNTSSRGTSTHVVATSAQLLVNSDVRSAISTSVHDQPMQVADSEGATAVHRWNTPVAKVSFGPRHGEKSGKQDVHNIRGKQSVRPDSSGDEQPVGNSSSSKSVSKRRKMSDAETSNMTIEQQKIKASRKTQVEKTREDMGEFSDVQSTGFSVHGCPTSACCGSLKDPALAVSSKSSAGFSCSSSPEISLQGRLRETGVQMVVLKEYKSKAVQGAKVMGKWKDGYYYPGILSKVDHNSKKYVIKFDDGSQRAVKVNEIILAAELPVGQSVMVLTSGDFYEPGMVMSHSEAQSEEGPAKLVYHVERDDGVTQTCDRMNLILSEDQAACLLSDEEMRISLDACAPSTSKPGDISLDNLVEGKRHLKSTKTVSEKEDQPSVSGAQSISVAVPASINDSENCQSGRKRKKGPAATSTPTPKQICKEGKRKGTPVKKPIPDSLGGAVASPRDSKKIQRKARTGLLFEPSSLKKSSLFEGMTFVLTHVEKSAQDRKQEKLLLEDSSLESSTDNNTDAISVTSPFVKEHLQQIIENNGGQVIHSMNDATPGEHCYLVAAEYQRTVKYLQALAAAMTIVSHEWILRSVAQNKLQELTAYILPAGISLEKKKIMERIIGCTALANLTLMVVSDSEEFIEAWTSILKMAHSHIVFRFPTRASKHDPGVDAVVSDSSCPATVVRRCQQLKVPLVSSEWVAQCLINGHLVEFKGHERYKHDFSS